MIYFERHEDKAKGDFYNGRLKIQDEPISESGKRDALNIARYFSDIPVSKIYASEYIRAQQTAQPLVKKKGLIAIVDARVNEINRGEFHSFGASRC